MMMVPLLCEVNFSFFLVSNSSYSKFGHFFFQVMLMEMQITANSTTSTNNDLIKGKSTITDIGKENDQKNIFLGPLLNTGWFLGRDIKRTLNSIENLLIKGPSINDVTHLGGRGICQKVTFVHKPIR